jgi:Zn-dependent M28 family amino/carboxypeptidase
MSPLLEKHLKHHVQVLAEDIGERNIWHHEQLESTVDYITDTWVGQGYHVNRQEFHEAEHTVCNLEIELEGNLQPEEIIVIGAHYDSVRGSPGANDNGSGVAAILELSRLFISHKPKKTVRFVAFVNEEPPFFLTRKMGSRVYAARSRKKKEKIIAMFSLETIGYYSERPGSQDYPFPLNFFYPDTADFIGFVSNIRYRGLMKKSLATFRRHSAFAAQGAAAPSWLTGVGWSDHWSFWREGYPAIMVTDTAFFRYDPYHTVIDTPEKLTYDKMAKVVAGLHETFKELAGVAPDKSGS